MAIKNIFVCGDSFCSADRNLPGTHFSEILTTLGYNVTNFARGGITNTAICYQIKRSIELKADIVIFTSTSSDRLDVPIKKFNPNNGLKNFIYPYESDVSTSNCDVGNLSGSIYSDVIPALINSRPDLPVKILNENQISAIKQYVAYLHSNELKQETDNWMIEYWKTKTVNLHLNNLPVGKILFDYVKNNPNKVNQSVYHTDSETQKKVAKEIKKLLDNNF